MENKQTILAQAGVPPGGDSRQWWQLVARWIYFAVLLILSGNEFALVEMIVVSTKLNVC